VSGFGVAAGYVGSLAGLIIVLPFVSGAIRARLPHALAAICSALSVAPASATAGAEFVRVNAYVPTALLWLLGAVPLLFFARLPRKRKAPSGGSPLRAVMATVRSLPKTPALLWFLLSNFLYIDVIHTVQIQMSTYSRFAVGLSDLGVQNLLLACTAVAIVGGLLYGYLCQHVTIRTATLVALGNWVLVFVLALLIRDAKTFYAVGVLAGIGLGGIKVTAKLGLIALVPKDRMAEFFGFFTLAGEAASVLGPLLWAATLSRFPDRSPAGYRTALAVLFVVLIAAIAAFLKVRFDEPREENASEPQAAA
jgi:UMF1 family MFS transporter